MYETYGDEESFIKEFPDASKVWTVMEGDDTYTNDEGMEMNDWYYVPGIHFVNRYGFIITELPGPEGLTEVRDERF